MLQRTISTITQSSSHQGFLGEGHTASAVFENIPYQETDPFILLMDDQLIFKGGDPVGGAHPHAGFETITMILEGNGGDWETGTFEVMTAGKGIIHTEEIKTEQKFRVLQLWLALPPEKRWAQPFWQKITLEGVPTLKNDKYEIRVYSGNSNGLSSPIKNHTPLTVVDFKMKANQAAAQELPANQKGFIYVVKGSVQIGDKTIRAGQAGWLDKGNEAGNSELSFQTQHEETHFILYAAKPHSVPVVSYGPFIGDTMEDIARLYKEYREGEMPHLNNLPADQKLEFNS